jgi:hypothetical protein
VLRKTIISLLASVCVFAVFLFAFGGSLLPGQIGKSSVASAAGGDEPPPAGKGGEGYPEQGIMKGVWNDGQAVFWDLDVIDHYRLFGAPERSRGYKPEQPIPFSHVTHVKENKMECQYCHWSVTKSPYAAIPEVETCMGCHRFIAGRTEEQQEGIKALKSHWNNSGEPYPREW